MGDSISFNAEPLLIPDIENKVGAIIVFAPLILAKSPDRLRRLETYLLAEFPDQQFVVTGDHGRPSDAVGAGFLTVLDGSPIEPDAAGKALIGRVLDAVTQFAEHGLRSH